QVTLWLKKIYGNARVPQYEVNKRTVDILHEVMECNEERDKDISLLIEDLKEREAKYEAEAQYWEDILAESLGLSVFCLSQEGTTDLEDLVESAMALEVEDTSLTSFYCAIINRTSELFQLKSKNQEMEWKVKTLTKKLTSALTLEKQLEADVKKIEKSQAAEKAKAKSRSNNLKFLEAKSEDIKIRICDAEETVIAAGLDQSLTHEALMKFSEEVAALQQEVVPLKKEVMSYHDLPP
ncbi:HAUS1 protein, partial [Malurus elegans]|nr:HAUS1 protein [Malurus elegans]